MPSPYDNFLEALTHTNNGSTYAKLLNTMNYEFISTENILNAKTSKKANSKNNVLKMLRLKNSRKIVIDKIKINSLRNEFKLLTEIV